MSSRKTLRKQLDAVVSDQKNTVTRTDALAERVDQLQDAVSTLRDELGDVRDTAPEASDEMLAETKDLKERLDAVCESNGELDDKLQAINQQSDELGDELRTATDHIDTLVDENIAVLEEKLREVQEHCDNTDERLTNLKGAGDQHNAEILKNTDRISEEIDRLRDEEADLRATMRSNIFSRLRDADDQQLLLYKDFNRTGP